jgi:hypothetical protein
MPILGGNPKSSDAGDPREPRRRMRSLEDHLASVTEGEGFRLAGDGIYVMAASARGMRRLSRRDGGRDRLSRRRRRRRNAGTDQDDRDHIANLDRVIVAFTEPPETWFRETPISIRSARHERSKFVISLRDILISASGEDRLPGSEVLGLEPDAPEGVPDVELLRALSSDLRMDEPDPYRLSEQFTPAEFRGARVPAFGAFRRAVNGAWFLLSRFFGFFRRSARVKSGRGRSALSSASSPADRRRTYVRALVTAAAIAVLAMIPAGAVYLSRQFGSKSAAVTAAGRSALGDLELLKDADIGESMEALRDASARFRAADELLSQTNALAVGLSALVPATRSNYRTARALLEIGSASSDAARLLAKGLDAALNEPDRSALDRLGVLAAYAEGALPLLDKASGALANVDEGVIPAEERVKIAALASGIYDGREAVREFTGAADLLANLLGRDEPRRFLIIFQNPGELRPTGGFMGSYAELDLYRGQIKRLEIPGGGTYDLQGQLTAQVIPPEPLTLIADRWEFQDSNWSPDFPTAAKKIRYFWSKSGGYTVDGIAAVNATLVQELLELTGPIAVPELGKTIDADNFLTETQKSVELEYDRDENQPKKILGLMGPRLIDKLKQLGPEETLKALALFSRAVERKDVQIALTDPEEDALAQSFGWSGRLKPATGDALAVIGANVAGEKTDQAIRESVSLAADVDVNGRIVNRVTIAREHTASKGELFTGVRNVTYFRVYVPRGSTLVDASGFTEPAAAFFDKPRDDAVPDPDIEEAEASRREYPSGVSQWDEGDRTVFGGWSMIDPGESRDLTLTYRLPFTAFDIRDRIASGAADESDTEVRAAYSLLLTSQSGKPDRLITTEVRVPEEWETRWSRAGEVLSGEWDRDKVVSALYVTGRLKN